MTTLNRLIASLAAVAAVALVGILAVGAGATGSLAPGPKPDLVPLLPSNVTKTQTTPVYVDSFVKPGHTVYRFDSVIFNRGGVLDMYHDASTGAVIQVVWPTGVPTVPPTPDAPPPSTVPGIVFEDRSPFGATFGYQEGGDHNHFHLMTVATYQFMVPGAGVLPAAKIGFCLVDTVGTPPARYFPYPQTTPGAQWCGARDPAAQFFREGISPQGGDVYNSQIDEQWIDVTGVDPGTYPLKAIVDPLGFIDEADKTNNTIAVSRTIPGVRVVPRAVRTVSRPTSLALTGTVVAPTIPARISAACFPLSSTTNCTRPADPTALTFRLASRPCYGSAAVTVGAGAQGKALYRPSRGVPVADGFAYVATDSRGLSSAPAVVRLGRPSLKGPPSACFIVARARADRRAVLHFTASGKIPPGTQWSVYVNSGSAPTAIVRRDRALTAPLDSGRNLLWLELTRDGQPLEKRVQSRELVVVIP